MNNGNQSAFPKVVPDGDQQINGLSKREYFTGLAAQGILASIEQDDQLYKVNGGYLHYESVAQDSVRIADALLAELSKPQP